jgi:hypothetical protein
MICGAVMAAISANSGMSHGKLMFRPRVSPATATAVIIPLVVIRGSRMMYLLETISTNTVRFMIK